MLMLLAQGPHFLSSKVLEQGFSNLSVHLNQPEGLLKHRCWTPPLGFLILIDLKWGPQIYISNSFPGDADAADLETLL